MGDVAHGGHCVARQDDDPHGRVVFVRHALPGERVRALVTEDGGGPYCRADAVTVLDAAPARVTPPCVHAGPGRCGGCDWQHVRPDEQRRLKAAVVREQFARLAGLNVEVIVEALPGGSLGWRTRTLYATDPSGRLGLHRHRSREVERLRACPLGVSGVGDHAVLTQRWAPPVSGVEPARDDDGGTAVIAHRPSPARPGRSTRGRRPPDRTKVIDGPDGMVHRVGGRRFTVAATGFWQVHPAAAAAFVAAVMRGLAPQSGERALDLYAGAGLFAAFLAEAVGPEGRVLGVEASARAVADATSNLADLPWAAVRRGRVADALADVLSEVQPDIVVLDPPRSGAGTSVMELLAGSSARAVGYVACDPAALARDVATAGASGWRMAALRAFDAFPMTHHVECVAILRR